MPYGEFPMIVGDIVEKKSHGVGFLMKANILEDDKTILSTRSGEVAFYEFAFHAVLRFPIHLSLGGSCTSITFVPLSSSPTRGEALSAQWWYGDISSAPCLSTSASVYIAFQKPKSKFGMALLQGEVGKNHNQGVCQQCQGMEEKVLLHLRGCLGIFPKYISRRRSFAGKHCNKLPILTGLKVWRLKRVFRKLGPGGFFQAQVVLDSKTFKKCFPIDSKMMGSSGGDNTEDKSVEEATVVSSDEAMLKGNQFKEKHPRDEVLDIPPSETRSKGKEAMPPSKAKEEGKVHGDAQHGSEQESNTVNGSKGGHLGQPRYHYGAQSLYSKKSLHG
ncbi:RNA-binding (RRM/RBD/RNP motifs) family protein [Actinidia rufa]|uniref:RNA-binding (RRM/RBD/RNP motifs) family protein n=1 Tax=Actinidia rufa TaxID=165716 RepID=A0A7J0EMA2_9ERIC|nr:RNA-binding (RRM/RBD/RNP motifs) family protein [Actinidia rufa]